MGRSRLWARLLVFVIIIGSCRLVDLAICTLCYLPTYYFQLLDISLFSEDDTIKVEIKLHSNILMIFLNGDPKIVDRQRLHSSNKLTHHQKITWNLRNTHFLSRPRIRYQWKFVDRKGYFFEKTMAFPLDKINLFQ